MLFSAYTAVDGGAQLMEFCLIVGHHALDAVLVQVPGDFGEGVSRLGELEQGVLEQVAVVRFKMDLPSVLQDSTVEHQEILVGQTPPGVAVGGPGVAEVDEQAVHLAGGKKLPEQGGVPVHEKDVAQSFGGAPLHSHDHSVRDPLHRDVEDVRVLLGRLGGKAAFSAAKL